MSTSEEEWCIYAKNLPESAQVEELVRRRFPRTSTKPNRTGDAVFLSFKSVLVAEMVLDICSQTYTSISWKRGYQVPAGLVNINLREAAASDLLLFLRPWKEENYFAKNLVDKEGGTVIKLPGGDAVVQARDSEGKQRLRENLRRCMLGVTIWCTDRCLPSCLRADPQPSRKREREEGEQQSAATSRKRAREEDSAACPVIFNPQQKLVMRMFHGRGSFDVESLQKHFSSFFPGSSSPFCRVVPTKERETVILEFSSEHAAELIMDEYVRCPSSFSGLTIYRDRDYIRPGSVNKVNAKLQPGPEHVDEVVVEGFSAELQHPELRGSFCELVDRALAKNGSISECGKGLLREFQVGRSRAYVRFNSNSVAQALISLEKPLVLAGRPLRLSYARPRVDHGEQAQQRPSSPRLVKRYSGRQCDRAYTGFREYGAGAPRPRCVY